MTSTKQKNLYSPNNFNPETGFENFREINKNKYEEDGELISSYPSNKNVFFSGYDSDYENLANSLHDFSPPFSPSDAIIEEMNRTFAARSKIKSSPFLQIENPLNEQEFHAFPYSGPKFFEVNFAENPEDENELSKISEAIDEVVKIEEKFEEDSTEESLNNLMEPILGITSIRTVDNTLSVKTSEEIDEIIQNEDSLDTSLPPLDDTTPISNLLTQILQISEGAFEPVTTLEDLLATAPVYSDHMVTEDVKLLKFLDEYDSQKSSTTEDDNEEETVSEEETLITDKTLASVEIDTKCSNRYITQESDIFSEQVEEEVESPTTHFVSDNKMLRVDSTARRNLVLNPLEIQTVRSRKSKGLNSTKAVDYHDIDIPSDMIGNREDDGDDDAYYIDIILPDETEDQQQYIDRLIKREEPTTPFWAGFSWPDRKFELSDEIHSKNIEGFLSTDDSVTLENFVWPEHKDKASKIKISSSDTETNMIHNTKRGEESTSIFWEGFNWPKMKDYTEKFYKNVQSLSKEENEVLDAGIDISPITEESQMFTLLKAPAILKENGEIGPLSADENKRFQDETNIYNVQNNFDDSKWSAHRKYTKTFKSIGKDILREKGITSSDKSGYVSNIETPLSKDSETSEPVWQGFNWPEHKSLGFDSVKIPEREGVTWTNSKIAVAGSTEFNSGFNWPVHKKHKLPLISAGTTESLEKIESETQLDISNTDSELWKDFNWTQHRIYANDADMKVKPHIANSSIHTINQLNILKNENEEKLTTINETEGISEDAEIWESFEKPIYSHQKRIKEHTTKIIEKVFRPDELTKKTYILEGSDVKTTTDIWEAFQWPPPKLPPTEIPTPKRIGELLETASTTEWKIFNWPSFGVSEDISNGELEMENFEEPLSFSKKIKASGKISLDSEQKTKSKWDNFNWPVLENFDYENSDKRILGDHKKSKGNNIFTDLDNKGKLSSEPEDSFVWPVHKESTFSKIKHPMLFNEEDSKLLMSLIAGKPTTESFHKFNWPSHDIHESSKERISDDTIQETVLVTTTDKHFMDWTTERSNSQIWRGFNWPDQQISEPKTEYSQEDITTDEFILEPQSQKPFWGHQKNKKKLHNKMRIETTAGFPTKFTFPPTKSTTVGEKLELVEDFRGLNTYQKEDTKLRIEGPIKISPEHTFRTPVKESEDDDNLWDFRVLDEEEVVTFHPRTKRPPLKKTTIYSFKPLGTTADDWDEFNEPPKETIETHALTVPEMKKTTFYVLMTKPTESIEPIEIEEKPEEKLNIEPPPPVAPPGAIEASSEYYDAEEEEISTNISPFKKPKSQYMIEENKLEEEVIKIPEPKVENIETVTFREAETFAPFTEYHVSLNEFKSEEQNIERITFRPFEKFPPLSNLGQSEYIEEILKDLHQNERNKFINMGEFDSAILDEAATPGLSHTVRVFPKNQNTEILPVEIKVYKPNEEVEEETFRSAELFPIVAQKSGIKEKDKENLMYALTESPTTSPESLVGSNPTLTPNNKKPLYSSIRNERTTKIIEGVVISTENYDHRSMSVPFNEPLEGAQKIIDAMKKKENFYDFEINQPYLPGTDYELSKEKPLKGGKNLLQKIPEVPESVDVGKSSEVEMESPLVLLEKFSKLDEYAKSSFTEENIDESLPTALMEPKHLELEVTSEIHKWQESKNFSKYLKPLTWKELGGKLVNLRPEPLSQLFTSKTEISRGIPTEISTPIGKMFEENEQLLEELGNTMKPSSSNIEDVIHAQHELESSSSLNVNSTFLPDMLFEIQNIETATFFSGLKKTVLSEYEKPFPIETESIETIDHELPAEMKDFVELEHSLEETRERRVSTDNIKPLMGLLTPISTIPHVLSRMNMSIPYIFHSTTSGSDLLEKMINIQHEIEITPEESSTSPTKSTEEISAPLEEKTIMNLEHVLEFPPEESTFPEYVRVIEMNKSEKAFELPKENLAEIKRILDHENDLERSEKMKEIKNVSSNTQIFIKNFEIPIYPIKLDYSSEDLEVLRDSTDLISLLTPILEIPNISSRVSSNFSNILHTSTELSNFLEEMIIVQHNLEVPRAENAISSIEPTDNTEIISQSSVASGKAFEETDYMMKVEKGIENFISNTSETSTVHEISELADMLSEAEANDITDIKILSDTIEGMKVQELAQNINTSTATNEGKEKEIYVITVEKTEKAPEKIEEILEIQHKIENPHFSPPLSPMTSTIALKKEEELLSVETLLATVDIPTTLFKLVEQTPGKTPTERTFSESPRILTNEEISMVTPITTLERPLYSTEVLFPVDTGIIEISSNQNIEDILATVSIPNESYSMSLEEAISEKILTVIDIATEPSEKEIPFVKPHLLKEEIFPFGELLVPEISDTTNNVWKIFSTIVSETNIEKLAPELIRTQPYIIQSSTVPTYEEISPFTPFPTFINSNTTEISWRTAVIPKTSLSSVLVEDVIPESIFTKEIISETVATVLNEDELSLVTPMKPVEKPILLFESPYFEITPTSNTSSKISESDYLELSKLSTPILDIDEQKYNTLTTDNIAQSFSEELTPHEVFTKLMISESSTALNDELSFLTILSKKEKIPIPQISSTIYYNWKTEENIKEKITTRLKNINIGSNEEEFESNMFQLPEHLHETSTICDICDVIESEDSSHQLGTEAPPNRSNGPMTEEKVVDEKEYPYHRDNINSEEEEFDSNLLHIMGNTYETSTICEICDRNEEISQKTKYATENTEKMVKFISNIPESDTSNNKMKELEEFDSNMLHIPEKPYETSTICVICDADTERDQLRFNSEEIRKGEEKISPYISESTTFEYNIKDEIEFDSDLLHLPENKFETSTICEICEENQIAAISFEHSSPQTIEGEIIETVGEKTEKTINELEEFGSNMFHFDRYETSTICEICEEKQKPEKAFTEKLNDEVFRTKTAKQEKDETTTSLYRLINVLNTTEYLKEITSEEMKNALTYSFEETTLKVNKSKVPIEEQIGENIESQEEFDRNMLILPKDSQHETSTLCEICTEEKTHALNINSFPSTKVSLHSESTKEIENFSDASYTHSKETTNEPITYIFRGIEVELPLVTEIGNIIITDKTQLALENSSLKNISYNHLAEENFDKKEYEVANAKSTERNIHTSFKELEYSEENLEDIKSVVMSSEQTLKSKIHESTVHTIEAVEVTTDTSETQFFEMSTSTQNIQSETKDGLTYTFKGEEIKLETSLTNLSTTSASNMDREQNEKHRYVSNKNIPLEEYRNITESETEFESNTIEPVTYMFEGIEVEYPPLTKNNEIVTLGSDTTVIVAETVFDKGLNAAKHIEELLEDVTTNVYGSSELDIEEGELINVGNAKKFGESSTLLSILETSSIFQTQSIENMNPEVSSIGPYASDEMQQPSNKTYGKIAATEEKQKGAIRVNEKQEMDGITIGHDYGMQHSEFVTSLESNAMTSSILEAETNFYTVEGTAVSSKPDTSVFQENTIGQFLENKEKTVTGTELTPLFDSTKILSNEETTSKTLEVTDEETTWTREDRIEAIETETNFHTNEDLLTKGIIFHPSSNTNDELQVSSLLQNIGENFDYSTSQYVQEFSGKHEVPHNDTMFTENPLTENKVSAEGYSTETNFYTIEGSSAFEGSTHDVKESSEEVLLFSENNGKITETFEEITTEVSEITGNITESIDKNIPISEFLLPVTKVEIGNTEVYGPEGLEEDTMTNFYTRIESNSVTIFHESNKNVSHFFDVGKMVEKTNEIKEKNMDTSELSLTKNDFEEYSIEESAGSTEISTFMIESATTVVSGREGTTEEVNITETNFYTVEGSTKSLNERTDIVFNSDTTDESLRELQLANEILASTIGSTEELISEEILEGNKTEIFLLEKKLEDLQKEFKDYKTTISPEYLLDTAEDIFSSTRTDVSGIDVELVTSSISLISEENTLEYHVFSTEYSKELESEVHITHEEEKERITFSNTKLKEDTTSSKFEEGNITSTAIQEETTLNHLDQAGKILEGSTSKPHKTEKISSISLLTTLILSLVASTTQQPEEHKTISGQYAITPLGQQSVPKCLIVYLAGENPNQGILSLNGTKWIPSEKPPSTIEEITETSQEIIEIKDITTSAEGTREVGENESFETTGMDITTITLVPSEDLIEIKTLNFVEEGCTEADFENNNNCFCMLDLTVDHVVDNLEGSNSSKSYIIKCSNFLKVNRGLIIRNDTTAMKRTKRSYLYLKYLSRQKREVVEYNKIDEVLANELTEPSTDTSVYAALDSTATIPCLYKDDIVEREHFMKYIWTSEGDKLVMLSDRVREATDGALKISDITVDDGGNYTCSINRPFGNTDAEHKHFIHELLIISRPVFKVKSTIMYDSEEPCSLKDGDIVHAYLPKLLEELLCGLHRRVCRVELERPSCVEVEEKSYLTMKYIVTLDPLTSMMPSISNAECDFDCQMKVLGSLTSLLIKNVETTSVLDVISEIKSFNHTFKPREVKFPADRTTVEDLTLLPKLIIGCPPGFGIQKITNKVCVACPRNAYSTDNTSICHPCPSMYYQPKFGSTNCIECKTPFDDKSCMGMMFANKSFLIVYIGSSIAIVFLILLCIFCAQNTSQVALGSPVKKKKSNTPKRRRIGRKDVEDPAEKPLLSKDPSVPRVIKGPKVPPPDF